jgi:hypothetical protein
VTGIVGIEPVALAAGARNPLGPVNGVAARALFSALAGWLDEPFSAIRDALGPLVRANPHLLRSPEGWVELARCLSRERGETFVVTVH